MSGQKRIETAEQALYQSARTFQALRAVAFLMSQTEGRGLPSGPVRPLRIWKPCWGCWLIVGPSTPRRGWKSCKGSA
jgi:hypothetical protein